MYTRMCRSCCKSSAWFATADHAVTHLPFKLHTTSQCLTHTYNLTFLHKRPSWLLPELSFLFLPRPIILPSFARVHIHLNKSHNTATRTLCQHSSIHPIQQHQKQSSTMKSFSTLATIIGTAVATTVSYDTGYGDASRSMNVVACSDGANGLETSEYSTF